MPAFDDLLLLEEKAQGLERILEERRTTMARGSRRALDLRNDLEKISNNLRLLRLQVIRLKTEYPVVLLSEFEQVLKMVRDNEDLHDGKQQELLKFQKEVTVANKDIPAVEAQLKQVLVQIDKYGKILEFWK